MGWGKKGNVLPVLGTTGVKSGSRGGCLLPSAASAAEAGGHVAGLRVRPRASSVRGPAAHTPLRSRGLRSLDWGPSWSCVISSSLEGMSSERAVPPDEKK